MGRCDGMESSGGGSVRTRAVGASYDAVARDYAEAFAGDLDQLPVDRAALDAFVARVGQGGTVLDAGCGPGAGRSVLVGSSGAASSVPTWPWRCSVWPSAATPACPRSAGTSDGFPSHRDPSRGPWPSTRSNTCGATDWTGR